MGEWLGEKVAYTVLMVSVLDLLITWSQYIKYLAFTVIIVLYMFSLNETLNSQSAFLHPAW